MKGGTVPIIMTNSIGGARVEACRAAGAQFIFDKTIELDQLLLAIRRLMAARQAKRSEFPSEGNPCQPLKVSAPKS